ncbi:alkaline phosphatase D family protein [Planctomycetota bacterium]
MKKIKSVILTLSVLLTVVVLLVGCRNTTLSPVDVPDGGHLSTTSRTEMGRYKGEKYQVCKIAMAQGDKAKITEVIEYCDKQLVEKPGNGEFYYIKAMAYGQLGDIDKAMAAVTQALANGVTLERFLAGPRNLSGPLTGSKKFRDYAANHAVELIHGPMLGDVTASSAKVWVRTAHEIPVAVKYSQNANMSGAILAKAVKTDRVSDFTAVVKLTGLKSNTRYHYQIVIDGKLIPLDRELHFTTTATKGAPTKFQVAFGGGSNIIPSNETMWDTIRSYHPAAILQLGDNTYFNIPDVTEHQQYFFYRRHSRPEYQRLIASVPVYAIWDDHDFGGNDSIGGADKWSPAWKHEIVLPQFMANFNNPYYGGGKKNPGCWFDFSVGDVDFFLLDGRYYRTDPQKPNPSMLGPVQLDWLLKKLKASTATFKILASPVPWAFGSKGGSQQSATFGQVPGAQDTWEGFPDERETIFSLIERQKIEGVYLISADRHRSDAWLIERPNSYNLYETSTSHLTKDSTHPQMPNAIFSILGKPAFGLLTIDTTLTDPQITYDVIKIDNEKVATLTVKHSQLKFAPMRQGN